MSRISQHYILLLLSLMLFSCSKEKESSTMQTPPLTTTIILEIDKEQLAKEHIPGSETVKIDLNNTCNVLLNRLEQLNYSHCQVYYKKDSTIVLKLPRTLENKVQKVLLSTNLLEMYPLLYDLYSADYSRLFQSIDSVVKSSGDSSTLSLYQSYENRSFPESEKEAITALLNRKEVKEYLKDTKFLWGKDSVVNRRGEKLGRFPLYYVHKKPAITGTEVKSARTPRRLDFGGFGIDLQFTHAGAKEFATITGHNRGKQLAIVIGDRVYSAPKIVERITSGNAILSGDFSKEEAKDLAIILSSGVNQLPLKIAEITNK